MSSQQKFIRNFLQCFEFYIIFLKYKLKYFLYFSTRIKIDFRSEPQRYEAFVCKSSNELILIFHVLPL